jgi:restriction system protein
MADDLKEFFRKQQEMRDKFYPPYLRKINELQKNISPISNIQKTLNLISEASKIQKFAAPTSDIQNTLRMINEASQIQKIASPISDLQKTLRVINESSQIHQYSNIFRVIEGLSGIHNSVAINNASFDSWIKLSQREYNFSELIEEEERGETIIIEETNKVKRIITDIYNDNSVLLKVEPRTFEEVIAEILASQGFKVELTKQTRDNGYDILAIKDIKHQSPLKYLVECKRYTDRKVGVEIIRSFKDVINTEKANKGIIVTTSYFTSEARKKQKEIPYILDFRDKDDLMQWISLYWQEKIRQ